MFSTHPTGASPPSFGSIEERVSSSSAQTAPPPSRKEHVRERSASLQAGFGLSVDGYALPQTDADIGSGNKEASGSSVGDGSGMGGSNTSTKVAVESKRFRSGSISGRLRAASDLEESGLIDKTQKGLIKDLIISGDTVLQDALDKYNMGQTQTLQDLIRSGLFQRRPSIDILNGLDLDFLQVGSGKSLGFGDSPATSAKVDISSSGVTGGGGAMSSSNAGGGNMGMNVHLNNAGVEDAKSRRRSSLGSLSGLDNFDFFLENAYDSSGKLLDPSQLQSRDARLGSIGGLCDLDFETDWTTGGGGDRRLSMDAGMMGTGSRRGSLGGMAWGPPPSGAGMPGTGYAYSSYPYPPPPLPPQGDGSNHIDMSAYEALAASLEINRARAAYAGMGMSLSDNYQDPSAQPHALTGGDEHLNGRTRRKAAGGGGAAVGRPAKPASYYKAQPRNDYSAGAAVPAGAGVAGGGLTMGGGYSSRRAAAAAAAASAANVLPHHHYTQHHHLAGHHAEGDPTVHHHCITANTYKGYIGAYNEEARRQRIERFLEKRLRRVWTKKVKYDVRKNFADSRVRVKGRFVKKEDEEIIRELDGF